MEVGQRVERPDDSYALAGYISEGTAYHPGAYQDPFTAGVDTAAAGAIIPVNAVPPLGATEFTIWWFEKVEPPDASFEPFYVPSKSGRYTVSYPTGADQIVLASNAGSGDLNPAEAAGERIGQMLLPSITRSVGALPPAISASVGRRSIVSAHERGRLRFLGKRRFQVLVIKHLAAIIATGGRSSRTLLSLGRHY